MICHCPNCGTTFEQKSKKSKPATRKATSRDQRKAWQKNSPDHKWNMPWTMCGTMLQETQRKHKSADKKQRVDGRDAIVIYAEAMNIPLAQAVARVKVQHQMMAGA